MEPSSQVVQWSRGDTALITDGEFSGTRARIWEVNNSEKKVLVSLQVFRENVPFEIDLQFLRKPPSTTRHLLKAILLVALCVVVGPVLFVGFLLAADVWLGLGPPAFFSLDVLAHTISWPLYIAAFFVVYIAFRVLTDPDSDA